MNARGCDTGNGVFTCTLPSGHTRDHDAHGTDWEVCATWSPDGGTDAPGGQPLVTES